MELGVGGAGDRSMEEGTTTTGRPLAIWKYKDALRVSWDSAHLNYLGLI